MYDSFLGQNQSLLARCRDLHAEKGNQLHVLRAPVQDRLHTVAKQSLLPADLQTDVLSRTPSITLTICFIHSGHLMQAHASLTLWQTKT